MGLGRVVSIVIAGVLLLPGSAGAAVWHVPGEFPTIQDAIDDVSVNDGDTIAVDAGKHQGATVTKAVTILGLTGATIVGGPVVNAYGRAGFLFAGGGEGSGATITGFRFVGVAFGVFSRGADSVSVVYNDMKGTLQGVTNWANGTWGRAWNISSNTITGLQTRCGGGIGILIGDYAGGTVSNNLIAQNTIVGPVRVRPDDCGDYNAPGIALFADFRFPGDLGAAIENNQLMRNKVSITSYEPTLVTVSGVELTDTRDVLGQVVISSNSIVYNDLRGMAVPVFLTPADLGPANLIDGNLTGPVPDRRSSRLAGTSAAPIR